MYITSRSLCILTSAVLPFFRVRAAYVMDNLSFGQKEGGQITEDLQRIPHWSIKGNDDYVPELLSDRIILTPPWPGNKRGSLWPQDALHHEGDWSAELHFRATGMDRGGGNLQLWYVKESQAHDPPHSLYTAPKFDGLVLVVDQYEGRGGSIRGFLNDGTIDIRSHPNPDTLAFGKCDYPYRNKGILTSLKIHHMNKYVEVTVDGMACFGSDKINLPDGYNFGISAASAENPDSFEVHRFIVSSSDPYPTDRPADHDFSDHGPIKYPKVPTPKAQEQPNTKQSPNPASKVLDDAVASTIRDQQEQFADLHYRVQDLGHRVREIQETLTSITNIGDQRWVDLMNRVVPIENRGSATMRNVEKIERTTMEILRDLESKDMKDMMREIHRVLEQNHEGLSKSLPAAMGAVYEGHKPRVIPFLFIAIAVQIMITGAYIVYKKRRHSAPKKYL